jgi:hypothetical protein
MSLKHSTFVFMGIVLAFAAAAVPAPAALAQTAPVITIDSPLGGRTYDAGYILTIRWRSDTPGNVRI